MEVQTLDDITIVLLMSLFSHIIRLFIFEKLQAFKITYLVTIIINKLAHKGNG